MIVDATHLTATFTISSNTFTGNNPIIASIGSAVSNPLSFDVV